MRPKSGGLKKSKCGVTSPRRLKVSTDENYHNASLSKGSASRLSSSSGRKTTWALTKQKLNICSDVKNIALIHAYQPTMLKKCLVGNTKSYKKFYNEHGGCSLSFLFTKSFLVHFRQWKQSLRQRLINLISMISDNRTLIKEQQIKMVFMQLETIAQQMKQGTQQVLNAKGVQQSKGQARTLHENFELMSQYIKSLFMIIKYLFEYSRNIQEILEEGTEKNENNIRPLQRKIKKLHKQYQHLITQHLHKCITHPQSSYMNKAQYKLKVKFDQIQKQSILALETIAKLRQLILCMYENIDILDKNQKKPEQFTVANLQEIVQQLNSIQEVKFTKKYRKDDEDDDTGKTHRVIQKQEELVNMLISQYLKKFKEFSLHLLEYEYHSLKKLKVVRTLAEGSDRYRCSKKKLLMLTKIFTRNYNPQYYEQLSTCIKDTSQSFQKIMEIIQKLDDKSKNKKYLHKNYINKNIEDVIELVSSYENHQKKICDSIEKICLDNNMQERIEYESSLGIKQSQKLKRFLQIMYFSQNRVDQLIQIPKYPQINKQRIITQQQIQQITKNNYHKLSKLIRGDFSTGRINSHQLKKLLNDELLQKFIVFSDDISKQSVYCMEIFYEFYNNVYGTEKNKKQIKKETLIKMLEYYEQNMKKLQNYKNCQFPKKFLQWMFENRVAMYVLNVMTKCSQIINNEINQQYWESNKMKNNQYSYKMNEQIRSYLLTEKLLLQQITKDANKYVTEKSIFDYYFQQSLQNLQDFIHKQQIFQIFEQSMITGLHRPTPAMLKEWANWEFNYSIDENCNDQIIKNIRNNVYGLLNLYVERIKQLISEQKQKKLLRTKFIQFCKKNIEDIQYILIPLFTSQTTSTKLNPKSNIKIENYRNIMKEILRYLRNNNMYHIAFFTKNQQQPLTFLLESDCNNITGFFHLFQKLLGIPHGSMVQSQTKFQKFSIGQPPLTPKIQQVNSNKQSPINQQFQQITEQYIIEDQIQQQSIDEIPFSIPYESKKIQTGFDNENTIQRNISDEQNQVCFIFEGKKKNREIIPQKIKRLLQKKDELCFVFEGQTQKLARLLKQQQIHQSSKKKLKTKSFTPKPSNNNVEPLLPPTNSQNQNSQHSQQEQIPSYYRKYIYYKILSLESLDTLSHSLKAIKSEVSFIKKSLQIQYLILAFQQKQPQQQLLEHLNQILKPLQQQNLINRFHKSNHLYKHRAVVDNLRKTLLINDNLEQNRIKRLEALKQLFDMLGYSYEIIYDEGEKKNKIILCEVGQNGHYAYAILQNQLPMIQYQQKIIHHQIIKIEMLFLKSLFSLPHQKNLHLDDIRELIGKENKEISKCYHELKKSLSAYKSYGIKNNQQISSKIDSYINNKTNNMLKFTEILTVDYNSFKKFIKQYKQLSMIFTDNDLINVYVNNNQQYPIFASKDYQQIKHALQTSMKHTNGDFVMIPQKFNSYIERISVDIVTIKYEQLINNIINELNKVSRLQLHEILSLLYENAQYHRKQKMRQQKIHQILNEDKTRDYRILAHFWNVISGETNKILIKLNQLEGQQQLLQKIGKIKQQNCCFVQQSSEIQKQNQFIKQISEKQSFLMEKSPEKLEIQSYSLEQLHNLLKKAQIAHRVVRYHGQTIALAQLDVSVNIALVRRLNINEVEKIKYNVFNHNEIHIQKLFIEVTLPNLIAKAAQSKQHKAQIEKLLQSYSIQINTQNKIQTLTNLPKQFQHPIQILCNYPRRSIQIKLKKKNCGDSQNNEHNKNSYGCIRTFITKNYCYGCKYILVGFEEEILCKIDEEQKNKHKLAKERKIKQSNSKNHYKKINNSEGDFPEQIKFMPIDSGKLNNELNELQSNQSIVLSEHIQIDRNNLIKMNNEYKFTNIDTLMKRKKNNQINKSHN